MHKNAAVPIIVMLDHSEIDIEVSDTGMETVKSNDYKKVLEDNRDTNGMLAMTQEEARFSHKDGWKFIDLFIQLISKLYWVSQLYSRTKEQKESSRVI